MRDKIVGIYLLQIDKYNYVGKSINVLGRVNKHKSNLKLNKHENPFMQNVYNKHKNFSYKILWTGEKEMLQIMEQMYIKWFNNSLNLKDACDQSISEEHKANISKAHKKSKKVQASVKRAQKSRLENGQTLTKERRYENRKSLNEASRNRYLTYTKFSFKKKNKIIVSTIYEFCMITGINKRSVEALVNHRQSNSYGWLLQASAINKPG